MTITAAEPTPLLDAYRAPRGAYDELRGPDGLPRPHWQTLAAQLQRLPPEDIARRAAQADRMLVDHGVAFGVPEDDDGRQRSRPWQLDLLPMAVAAAEWRWVEGALAQRARLLEAWIRDVHGPQKLLADGAVPAAAVFAHPGFLRPFHGLPAGPQALTLYAAELARGPSGQWHVMADRTAVPYGLGYALENRIVVGRALPQMVHRVGIQRLAPFFVQLQNALAALAPRRGESARVVLLSSGPKHRYFFEDAYLARYLGYTLAEGGDLAVRDDRLYLKTLAGLAPVDVVWCRGNEHGLDPLELGGADPHGVPGLLNAVRRGHVALANLPGCGIVEAPITMAFLPKLCQAVLGEPLRLPSIATWWCGDAESRRYVLDRLPELVFKPAFAPSGGAELFGAELTRERQAELRARIAARPHEFIAQETIVRSATPAWRDGRVQCGHAAVRAFLVADGAYRLMPGGLLRMAPTAAPMELSISAGESSKDLWVLADGPIEPVTLLHAEDAPVALRRTSAQFPSRVADDLFWLGQSLDRADFLCRLVRATAERLAGEADRHFPELPALVQALACQGQIEAGYAVPDFRLPLPPLDQALPRVAFDTTEIRGLGATVLELLRLASLVRDWISPETWTQARRAGTAFLDARAAAAPAATLADVLAAANQLLLDLAAVSGLIHDGMIRGPAWRFFDIGRCLERGRNAANFLGAMLPAAGDPDAAKPVLKAIVEILDCRMTYRSRYHDNLQANAVCDLAITDATNPRSIVCQAVALSEHVDALPRDESAPLRSEEKRAAMAAVHAARMLAPEQLGQPAALLPALAELERNFRTLSNLLSRRYLVHSGVPRQVTGAWN